MGKRKVVKDKLYRFAEKTGVQKSYWHLIFDVSETALRKWSYNPANVSEEMRKHIMTRIRMWDALHVYCYLIADDSKFANNIDVYLDYEWQVIYGSGNKVMIGYGCLPRFLNMVLEHAIATCPDKVLADIMDPNTIAYRNGGLMKIVLNDLYEMPPGVNVWDESLTKLAQMKGR